MPHGHPKKKKKNPYFSVSQTIFYSQVVILCSLFHEALLELSLHAAHHKKTHILYIYIYIYKQG